MNKQTYRLVFSRLRGMLVAVEETATGNSKASQGETTVGQRRPGGARTIARFALRHAAFAVLLMSGMVPALVPVAGQAQVVAAPGSGAKVIQTQNGLPQVNIARPSNSGVSLNTYSQFDVQKPGAILNNSPTIVSTQQAGYINGNPNFAPGQSAKIIVNQVNSNSPSQLNGYVEVAGSRAEVVIANPSGLSVNGGGFINTSRAILTTGSPVVDATGNLTGFNVTGGQITVQGAGLNATNTDQIDLIARAVAVNAALYANTLNVVTGANQVDHNTLAATPIAGNGAPPAVSIDVSQLGGMYANRIFLASNENGVGVSNAGVIAAQAGDLTLTTQGQLMLAGKTNASGNMALSAQGGIDNTGTTYGQGSVSVSTAGTLTNSGTLAAQQNLSANAGSVASTGTLGAGINSDGSIAKSGDLTVVSSGPLTATGQNAAGGNATLQGSSLNLAGSQTSANGSLELDATSGDLNLNSAKASAGGQLNATARGTLTNDNGSLTSAGAQTLTAGALSNNHGTIADSGTGALSIRTGTLSNNGGTIATNGALDVNAGAVSNEGGKLVAQSQTSLTVASLDNSAGGYVGAQNVAVTDAGALNNAGGTLEANGTLTASAQTIADDGGSIRNSGTQVTSVAASGALTNTQGGEIAGNGNVSVSGGSVNNSGGTVLAGGAATVQSGSTLTNAAGLIQGNGNVTATATGAVTNIGGQIESNGSTTTLTVSGSSLDNTNGRIANTGTGATTVSAASITNANPGGVAGAGTIGGNGDVALNGQTLSNTQGAQVVAGHNLTLNVAQSVNNNGGTLLGSNNLTLNESGAAVTNQNGSIHGDGAITMNVASLDNTSGRIGNDSGSGGSVTITAGTLTNQAGAIGSDQNLSVTTNQLSGDGSIVAGNDGTVAINSSYTNGAANTIQANHNLTFTTTGNFTNQGTLQAVNALTVNAPNVDNQAGAVLNSASTTVNASNALTNEGTLEGATVTTQSGSLTNTGTVVGNNVTLNAGSIDNTGSAAAIAAATQLNLYASNELSNTGGANIQSLGNLNIAADANRDANGLLADRTGVVTNDQSTIQAQGNMEIAAGTLNNTRPAPVVSTVTTDVSNLYQTKRSKYLACATGNADGHSSCTQAVWNYGYKSPVSSTYATSQIVSETSGASATSNVLVVNVGGQQQTIYYNSITNNGNGTVTVNYWDDYNPNINYLPSTEYATRSDAHHGYQRVEIARNTTTTTQQDQVTSQAPEAQLLAGGNMTLANVGTINNSYSAIAAGGSIQIGSTQQGGAVGSGSYGGTTVNNTGQTLYQYQTQNIVSTYAWNENTSQDVGTVVEAPVVLAPVAIGGTGGTIIANNAVNINASNLNNTNVAAANSATGATGATLGANQAMAGVSPGALQTVAGSNGQLTIKLPTSGLYTFNTAPGQPYLIATNPMLTSYTSFISSNYMLQQLGLNPQAIEKRLGDGLYEENQVQNQITQLTGRVYLQGYADNEDEYKALMTAGVNADKQFNLEPGIALTQAQMDALTSDIVWLVNQTVTLPDGSTQQVLAPVVYLAHTHANDLQPTGALITADDVEIHATGSAVNSGVIKGGTQTVVSATNIVNRAGTIGSSATNGTTVVAATNDVINASGQITGNRVAVLAGNNIVNTTLVDTIGVSAVSGDSKVNSTLLGAQGSIASTGDLMVSAGHDLTVDGANITAGGNAQITAGHDITVDTVQSTTSQSVDRNANHHWEANSTTSETSAIAAGGSLAVQSGNDATFKGAQVTAGTDLSVVAGGNLTASAVTNTSQYDNVATDSKTRQEVDHTYDQQTVGSSFSAGRNATLAAVNAAAGGNRRTDGGGNVTLTGSSVTAGANTATPGTATILANGNVTLTDAREEHDTSTDVTARRGSVVSSTTSTDNVNQTANNANGSVVSGDAVAIGAGKNVTVQGSDVVGTNNVAIAALGNVNIVAAQNTAQDSELHDVKHSGLSGTGGIGFTVGSSEQKETYNSSSVTESQSRSMVGASQGNVSISAGQDLHIGGSDIVAGKAANDVTGATGNIGIRAQNITIDPGQDTAQSQDQQSSHSSGFTVAVTGTPLDTVRNLKAASSSGNAYQRTTGVANEITASTLDTPSISLSYGTSSSSSNTNVASVSNAGSTVRGAGNVSLTATGGALKDANGNPLDGDITVTGSTITAGGTATFAANRNVTFQASSDQLQQSTQSSSSSSSFQLASPSLGDLSRWVQGGPNSGGVSSSPYNAASSSANGNSASTQQTATVVTGNSVVVKSNTGDINVIGSGISGTQGVDLVATQGAINVLAGTDTNTGHQESSSSQIGSLGSNGTGTGFSVGVANSHSVQDTAAQTQGTIRSQVVSQNGDVTLDAKQDVTVQGSDLSAGKDLTLIGKNLNLDPGTDATQSSASQSSSQYGVTLALGGVVGNAVATVNQAMTTQSSQANNPRLAALDKAEAGLAAYGAAQAAISGSTSSPALIKATVSIGGGSSHSQSQSNTTTTDGSTLTAGGAATLVATGSGAKDANGYATDGDINSVGTQITAQNVTLNAARDINLQSAQNTTQNTSSNSSSSASIGVGASLGGTQNGFTIELAASSAKGNANGHSVTNENTQITAANTVSVTSGRDTNLVGADVSGNTVDANVGRNLTITSPQDTNTYNSQQSSAGFQASICVPPICYGQTVSGSVSASDQSIKDNFRSVGQQSGIDAGTGGYDVSVGNHTQLNGGVIASTATSDKNTLSTQTFGYTNLQNIAQSSGSTIGFSASGGAGQSTPDGVSYTSPVQTGSNTPGAQNSQGQGPLGFGVAGTSNNASGTTYAAVSPGTITVRGDAGTGQDSTAGLSRDTANANGSVQNTFNAQNVANDMAIQQVAGQVGMQVVGDVATSLENKADAKVAQDELALKNANASGDADSIAQAQANLVSDQQQAALWSNDGAARIGSHAAVAALGAALGGGSVAGAVGGTVAGDVAGSAVNNAMGDNPTLAGTLLANIASGAAGAVAGGALGGSAGALSGANGALSADLYNRQLHPNERVWAMQHANAFAAYYASVTGQTISSTDAQNMLLANGYIRVDNAAASGPGYNAVAAQYLTANAGSLFSATPAEMANPQLGRNPDGTPTPEVFALPGGTAVPGAGKAAAAGLGLTTLGVAAPAVATAWALGTAYDYAGDTIGHLINPQVNDSPDFSKSFTVGGVAGLMAPLLLPVEAMGPSVLAKIGVTGYNSVVTGTAAFGGTAITTPESSPSLSGGLGATANAVGAAAQTWLPKHLGDIVNQVIQVLPGPTQSGIEHSGNQQK